VKALAAKVLPEDPVLLLQILDTILLAVDLRLMARLPEFCTGTNTPCSNLGTEQPHGPRQPCAFKRPCGLSKTTAQDGIR
jgi:hypothetical protein